MSSGYLKEKRKEKKREGKERHKECLLEAVATVDHRRGSTGVAKESTPSNGGSVALCMYADCR